MVDNDTSKFLMNRGSVIDLFKKCFSLKSQWVFYNITPICKPWVVVTPDRVSSSDNRSPSGEGTYHPCFSYGDTLLFHRLQ